MGIRIWTCKVYSGRCFLLGLARSGSDAFYGRCMARGLDVAGGCGQWREAPGYVGWLMRGSLPGVPGLMVEVRFTLHRAMLLGSDGKGWLCFR